MESNEELIMGISEVQKRYEKIKKKFKAFSSQTPIVTEPVFPLKNITVEPSDDMVVIRFHEKELNILFDYDCKNRKGIIKTVEVDPSDKTKTTDINSFSFDGEGKADIISPDGTDPYNITYDADVISIVLNSIYLSLTK